MKRKTMVAIVLAATMAVGLLAGCGKSSSSDSSVSADGDSLPHWTIGYSNRDDTETYLKAVEDEFKALVDADDTLDVIYADAESDSQQQLDQLDNFDIQGIDCAVVSPQDCDSVVDHIEQWNESGIPVFCNAIAANGGDFTFVGPSDYDLQLIVAEWAYENLPENAKVLYLGGNTGYQISIDRRQALVDGLGDRLHTDWEGNVVNEDGDIEVLSWQECDYSREDGMSMTEDWIQTFSDFDAIIAVNDRSALGAIEALQGAGMKDVVVCGVDGIEEGLQAVKDGTMACTAIQNSKTHAELLYQGIKAAQAGEENPESLIMEVYPVDSSNVDEYLN